MLKKILKPEEEWEDILTPQQFAVLRQRGTEPAFSGKYLNEKDEGVYRCAACDNMLFSSEAKYDSGTGWPSFFEAIEGHIELGLYAHSGTEVLCAQCDSHLGHVFEDGPDPTGLRYCIDSVALKFDHATKSHKKVEKESSWGAA